MIQKHGRRAELLDSEGVLLTNREQVVGLGESLGSCVFPSCVSSLCFPPLHASTSLIPTVTDCRSQAGSGSPSKAERKCHTFAMEPISTRAYYFQRNLQEGHCCLTRTPDFHTRVYVSSTPITTSHPFTTHHHRSWTQKKKKKKK